MKLKDKEKLVQDTRPELEHIYADEKTGLTDHEAMRRIDDGYSNIPIDPPTKTIKQIIFSNVFTYFNLIFIILSIALIIVGSFKELTFLVTVVANTVICTFQEIRAKKTLDKLSLINTPVSLVVRSGREINVPSDNLVIDDIVVFTQGVQICADAQVVSGEVTVNESLVTGESDEIVKKSGDGLLSGSFVISGKCYARLTAVGKESYVSRLTIEAKRSKKIATPGMMKSLNRLIQVIGILIIPVAIFLFINHFVHLSMPFKDSVEKTVAALVGMIPEGLYLLTSIALAVSVIRLAGKKTLVRELGCIERLARVDTLCIDKTGTITENEMKVCDIVPLLAEEKLVNKILYSYTANMACDNNTMNAIKCYVAEVVTPTMNGEEPARASYVLPFSSRYKFSGVTYEEGRSFVMGAPELLVKSGYEKFKPEVDRLASEGKRVVLVAGVSGSIEGAQITGDVIPLGLIGIMNPIRPNAAETFRYFAEQGVDIKIISGDNPLTVSKAAENAGITDTDNYVDMSSIVSDEELVEAAEKYKVFGRTTPDQKKKLIAALKSHGHTVAMTGDGVNDVLALKEADCSVAMAAGSEVASQVSQIVLLESDFACLPSVVAEGRRVINNIERSASLFLVKNIFSFILAWVTILAVFTYPLQPSQLTLINIFTIGIPSFILALEPNRSRVRGNFLRNVLWKAFPAGLTDFIVILFAVLFSNTFGIPEGQISTVSAILMAVVGFVMLIRVCRPFNALRVVLVIVMAIGFIAGYVILGNIMFSMNALETGSILVLVVLALLVFPIMYGITKIMDFFAGTKDRIKILKAAAKNSETEADEEEKAIERIEEEKEEDKE